mmetsp:Transcript_58795/g.116807  ORF Transcript_58795/g.116807 Transcript_58795/m.116807 type:complete len:85 (+) Transcript_58795:2192-2446(+)
MPSEDLRPKGRVRNGEALAVATAFESAASGLGTSTGVLFGTPALGSWEPHRLELSAEATGGGLTEAVRKENRCRRSRLCENMPI